MTRLLLSPLLPVSFAFLLRFGFLHDWAFSVDEAYELYAVQLPLRSMLQFLAHTDSHPPLYYLLLWLWTRLSTPPTELFLRLPGALFGFLTVALAYPVLSPIITRRPALLATYLLAFSPLLIRWSHEARMFSLATLLGLVSLHFLSASLQTNRMRHWLAYILASAAGLYTMYAFALLLGAYAFSALLYRSSSVPSNLCRRVLPQMIPFLLFVPWLSFLSLQAHRETVRVTWPDWAAALWTTHLLLLGPLPQNTAPFKLIPVFCAAVAFLLGARCLVAAPHARPLLLGTVLPVLLAASISVRSEPLMRSHRVLLPVVPNLSAVLAAGAIHMGRPLLATTTGGILILNVWSFGFLRRQWPYISDFDKLTRFLSHNALDGDYYIAHPPWAAYALRYYMKRYQIPGTVTPYSDRVQLTAIAQAINGKRQVWLVYDNASRRTPYLRALLSEAFGKPSTVFFGNAVLMRYTHCPAQRDVTGPSSGCPDSSPRRQ